MSFELCGKVINDREITDVRLFSVMMCLAEATNHETGTCYPSLDRIAMVARCGRRTAIRSMEHLEKKGWITVIRRTDPKGGSLANIYRITKYLAAVTGGSATQTPPECHRDTPGVPAMHGGGASHAQRGGATVAPKPVIRENKEEEPIRNAPEELVLTGSPKVEKKKKSVPVSCHPPSIAEFTEYAKTLGVDSVTAARQYRVWSTNDWRDGYGTQIFSWKGKLTTFVEKDCLAKPVNGNSNPSNGTKPNRRSY